MPPVMSRLPPLFLAVALALPASSALADEEDALLYTSSSASEEPAAKDPAPDLAPPPGADPADDAEARLKSALERIVAIEVALAQGETVTTRQQLVELRNELHEALVALGQLRRDRDLRAWLEERNLGLVSRPSAEARPDSTPAPAEVGPMTEDDLVALQRSIEAAPFNEGKLQLLQDGIADRTLASPQAERLLELFSFSRDRVEVLVFLHPRLGDPGEFDRLLKALKFESDRQAVRDRLRLDSTAAGG